MTDQYIEKIHIQNFKGFQDRIIDGLQSGLNILIGGNDTGKSSVLLAVDLVLSANANRIETIGLDRLMNQRAVEAFLEKTGRSFADLPIMEIDLYLTEQGRHEFDGEFNIAQQSAYGICLVCRPRDDLRDVIDQLAAAEQPTFPFEYYSVEIKTFSGQPLSPYKKPMHHISIDNTKISNDYASRSYVQSLYGAQVDDSHKSRLKHGYRHSKEEFARTEFAEINAEIDGNLEFSLKSGNKNSLEADLSITSNGVDIENLGVGSQCFIRTQFALSKKSNIDVVLLEEPENHLSHSNMRRLIEEIKNSTQSQVFVATHSSLVTTRLDLRNAIMFGSFDNEPVRLNQLPTDTAEYFIKAPSNSMLEFALSERCLLVEGDAEYILLDAFFRKITGNELSASGINVISIGGISFPRYLEIAKLLGVKVAVVTDNDGDGQTSCVERYAEFDKFENIRVFFDPDDDRSTFEITVYQDNTDVCEEQFGEGRKTLSVQEFMLKNKSHVALELTTHQGEKIIAPKYIQEAITWLIN